MEKVYPRVAKTDKAEVYLRETTAAGKPVGAAPDKSGRSETAGGVQPAGRVIYFPWDIDRTFWEVLCVDHLKLLRNAVEWATGEEPPVTVTGPGMLDVTVWRQKGSMTVHLVNLTNPMMMKGPLRELIPAPAQKVRIRLPDGATARRVRLLAAGINPEVERRGQYLSLTVPSVLDHEVLAIDW